MSPTAVPRSVGTVTVTKTGVLSGAGSEGSKQQRVRAVSLDCCVMVMEIVIAIMNLSSMGEHIYSCILPSIFLVRGSYFDDLLRRRALAPRTRGRLCIWSVGRYAACLIWIVVAVDLSPLTCQDKGDTPSPSLTERNYLSPLLNVATIAPKGAEYVALGDSYAATATFSEVAPLDACTRTPRNLARQLAQNLQPASFTDASCAGASLADIITPRRNGDKNSMVAPAQIDAVGEETRLITLLAGFNSYGFGEVLVDCLKSYQRESCNKASSRLDISEARVDAENAARKVLAALRSRAPKARIVILGYMDMFDAYTPGCVPLITADGVAAWRRWFPHVNLILGRAAEAANMEYVAPPSSHGACAVEPYIQATGRDMYPDGPDAFAYHPNQRGQTAYVLKILKETQMQLG